MYMKYSFFYLGKDTKVTIIHSAIKCVQLCLNELKILFQLNIIDYSSVSPAFACNHRHSFYRGK